MFVKPAPNADSGCLLVRDPWTKQPLPADGAEVPETSYWLRRLKAGDVLAASASEVAEPAHTVLHSEQIPDSSNTTEDSEETER